MLRVRSLDQIMLVDSFVERKMRDKVDIEQLTLLANAYLHAGDSSMARRLNNLVERLSNG